MIKYKYQNQEINVIDRILLSSLQASIQIFSIVPMMSFITTTTTTTIRIMVVFQFSCLFRLLYSGTAPQSFFVFHDIDLLKCVGQLCCRNPAFGIVECLLNETQVVLFSQENHSNNTGYFLGHPPRKEIGLPASPSAGDVDLITWLKWYLTGFSTAKLQCFPYNKYSIVRHFQTMSVSYFC